MLTTAERKKDIEAIHAPGKPTRVKVNPLGATLDEEFLVNGALQFRRFKAGEVFDHPAPARVKTLIELGLVKPTDEKTKAELAAEKNEDEVAVSMVMDDMREKAKKIVLFRKEKMGKLDKILRGMTPDVLKAEAEKRGIVLSKEANSEAVIKLVMADEESKLKEV